jgi:hypothetical protein
MFSRTLQGCVLWPFVDSELDAMNLVAWGVPPAVMVGYLYFATPFDLALLLIGAGASGIFMTLRRRRWRQRVLAVAWCAIPLGFPYVEQHAFERRVRGSLPEFETAAQLLLSGDVGPCWQSAKSEMDCDVQRFSPTVRRMTTQVRVERHSVLFMFKEGSRRGLLYDSEAREEQVESYVRVAPGWYLRGG